MLDVTGREVRIVELPGVLLDELRREALRRRIEPGTLFESIVAERFAALADILFGPPIDTPLDVSGIDVEPEQEAIGP